MINLNILPKVRKKAKISNRCNQLPHLTQDTDWESDKNTREHHIQGTPEVSPFLTGHHRATRKRHHRMAKTNNKNGPQKNRIREKIITT